MWVQQPSDTLWASQTAYAQGMRPKSSSPFSIYVFPLEFCLLFLLFLFALIFFPPLSPITLFSFESEFFQRPQVQEDPG